MKEGASTKRGHSLTVTLLLLLSFLQTTLSHGEFPGSIEGVGLGWG